MSRERLIHACLVGLLSATGALLLGAHRELLTWVILALMAVGGVASFVSVLLVLRVFGRRNGEQES